MLQYIHFTDLLQRFKLIYMVKSDKIAFFKKNSLKFSHLTFFPPGDEVSGGGVLVMFNGLEPQLEGEDPRILLHRQPNYKRHKKNKVIFFRMTYYHNPKLYSEPYMCA